MKATKASASRNGTLSSVLSTLLPTTAPRGDLAQARVVLLALGTGLDERLDFRVEAGEELVQSLPQRLELGRKSPHALND